MPPDPQDGGSARDAENPRRGEPGDALDPRSVAAGDAGVPAGDAAGDAGGRAGSSAPAPAGPDLARAALARAKADARARGAGLRRRPAPGSGRARAGSGTGRDPQPFGAEINRLVDDRGWEPTVAVASVMGRWDQLVGPELAAHCRPEKLENGLLMLVAESTAWATQVRLLAPTLLARLADQLGAGVVTGLRVHGPATPRWSTGPRRVTGGRGPRDTYG